MSRTISWTSDAEHVTVGPPLPRQRTKEPSAMNDLHDNRADQDLSRGAREYAALMGSAPEETLAQLRERSPHLYESVVELAFGGPLARPELGRAQRELAVHVRAALHLGIAPSELLALSEHVAMYAGFPRAINAANVVDEVASQAGLARPPRLRRVCARDHETGVAEAGDGGPPVVLIHALGL